MDDEALAREFEQHRPHLRAVAHRMLGSLSEADDAVQEAWLRLHRSDVGGIDNLAALLSLLDPDVVLRADPAGVSMGAEAEVRGARAVARTFSGRARAARLALVDGEPGAVWAQDGTPRVVFAFTVTDGRVSEIELL